jgi:SPP1 family predicted phage head-tail adaptor
MDLGALNKLISIVEQEAGSDSLGQPNGAWEPVRSMWANIKHPNGAQTIRGEAETSLVKASIRVLYCDDLHAGMRALHGTKIYDIKAVLPDEVDQEFTDLVCELLPAEVP